MPDKQQQRSPAAIKEARKREGIRTDLRAIRAELGELRRDVEAIAANLSPKAPEFEAHRSGQGCR